MATISIIQKHQLSSNNARSAAQEVAKQLAEDYDIVSEWEGNVMSFKRNGVSGTLVLREKEAHLDIMLGFLLSAFAPRIEEQVAKKMKKVFG